MQTLHVYIFNPTCMVISHSALVNTHSPYPYVLSFPLIPINPFRLSSTTLPLSITTYASQARHAHISHPPNPRFLITRASPSNPNTLTCILRAYHTCFLLILTPDLCFSHHIYFHSITPLTHFSL